MKKKLIEVALPLEAINKEAAREKSIRHGHPSTLHLWWARRPLAACRAVLFASLVDDPSSRPDEFPTEGDQDRERQRLFRLIEELVKWENSNNKQLLAAAHAEILKSADGNPPAICDPFCGGGSIPLEAQRLGLEAHGSDLNPVAVLITKAMIEIAGKFAGRRPVHPMAKGRVTGTSMWEGARGLADDVRYYGEWMRDRARDKIGPCYPKVRLPKEFGGEEVEPIAWLWARTVVCPNPACRTEAPLVRSFMLSTRPGAEFWVVPKVNLGDRSVSFSIRRGHGEPPEGTVIRKGCRCLACSTSIPFDYVRSEGRAGRLGNRLMAIVAEGSRGRVYVAATPEHESVALKAKPTWCPTTQLPDQALGFRVQLYGMTQHADLFTARQMLALSTICDLIEEVREEVLRHGGSEEYSIAVATFLAFAIGKSANLWSSLSSWMNDRGALRETFARQALSMVWDYAEANPFSQAGGNFMMFVERIADVIDVLPCKPIGWSKQLDAAAGIDAGHQVMFSTDPPYYDNIGYGDLSDFFYVWLRKALMGLYPELFSTLLVPKTQEMIANPYRFEGDGQKAREFFESGMMKAFNRMREMQDKRFPLTVFYAFKQSETEEDEDSPNSSSTVSTGWETMLEALLRADFEITGTWPMKTESAGRNRARASNALASSIVLVCRTRPIDARITTRKDFLATLKRELPAALKRMQLGNIAPVDLAQATIGPGMGVFSSYKKVLETDGSSMRVHTALGLINQTLDEVLSEQEGEFDPDTRWALAWFEQHAFDDGLYGEAEVLATAKALSISGLAETGILHSRAGKVRLLRRDDLPENWDPSLEHRLTVWSVTQHLIRSLDKNGETATSAVAAKVGGLAEIARDLAYRLYILSERKGWAEEAGYYNSLVVSWPAIAPKAFALS
jgi:putative DNA methylase